jgi:hypothetical protein
MKSIIFRRLLLAMLASCLVVISSSPATAQKLSVAFDVPALVVAQPVNPAVVQSPTMGGPLLRLKIPVSTFISPEFRGAVTEYSIELYSPGQTLRVVDFWPKNETYTEYEGTVTVESSRQKQEHFQFDLAAAYPTVGHARVSGDYRNHLNVEESYQRKPPMQTLTSSGTIRQGFGAFYKFRPGPIDVLEGSREIALLVEAPAGWRADMLQAWMTAVGTTDSGSGRVHVLGQSRMWVTTHQEGDGAAAAQAIAYVRNERTLRGLAASRHNDVQQRSMPTLLHKVGAALDMVPQRIPQDYLERALFGPESPRFDEGTQRLPVDLRVAILDYWEARSRLLSMAQSSTTLNAPAIAMVQ